MKKILSLLLFMTMIGSAFAQVTTSSISGNVVDEKGQPLVGTAVIAVHTPSGTEYGTVVDAKGNYRLMNVRPGGPYTVTFKMLGYKTVADKGITIPLGDNYVLRHKMSEESTGIDAVVVSTSKNSIMNSNRTGTSTNVNARQITTLPTISRSITDFTRLTPQAGNNGTFGGRDTRYNNVTVDGAQFSQRFGLSSSNNLPGGDAQPISLDAIQEISVNLTPFDILQSNFTGANVNAITKSGDNNLSASVYTFLRPKSFTGKKVGDKILTGARETDKSIYGLSVGGPIIKNKLFFFANGEIEKTTEPGNQWNPSTDGKGDGPNKISRVTESDMKSMSDFLQKTYNYNPGGYKDFGNFTSDNYKIMVRLDWNINKTNKVMVRYNEVKSTNDVLTSSSMPERFTSNGGRNGLSELCFSNSNYTAENRVRSITGEWNSTFADNISNKFLATYTKISDQKNTLGDPFPFVDILKDNEGYMSFGPELFSNNNVLENSNFSIINNTTIALGNHNLTAGLSYENQFFSNGYQPQGTSYYLYESMEAFMTNAEKPKAFSYQLGYPGNETPRSELTFGLASIYAQDDWQISDKFKLTAGIRFELPIYYTDLLPGTKTTIDDKKILVSDIAFDKGEKINIGEWPSSKLLVSPRIGFNWDVLGDRSLQIRGGTGIFTGMMPFVWFTNQPGSSAMFQTPTVKLSGNKVPDGMRFNPDYKKQVFGKLATGIPEDQIPVKGEAPSYSTFAKVSDDFKLPQLWRNSLAVDVKLPADFIFTVEAIYSKDINAVIQRNINLSSVPTGQLKGPDNRHTYGKVYSKVDGAVVLDNSSKGHQASLTLQLSKSFSYGLSGMIAYTYSSAKDMSANPGSQALSAWKTNASVGNLNDAGLSYSAFSMPHRVTGYISYSVDWLKHCTSTFSLYYNGINQGRLSYTFSNDRNGDNWGADLIYIPKNKEEMTFADVKDKKGNVTYSSADQANDFEDFINGNSYLKKNRGKYAERYADVQPWVNKFDFKFLQDVYTNFGTDKRYTLQLSLDILNVGNLLNKNWGSYSYCSLRSYENFQVLKNGKPNKTTGIAEYTLNANDSKSFKERSSWSPSTSIGSTWGIQIGARLKF